MENYRQDSLVIDFSVMPAVPDLERIKYFLENQVKLQLSSVRNLQVNVSRSQVIIEMASPKKKANSIIYLNWWNFGLHCARQAN